MTLPDEDTAYLQEKGYKWELQRDGASDWWLLLKSFPVDEGKFDRREVDLIIRIPPQYNLAGLDMWYVFPEVKLRSAGAHPPAASHFEDHLGRRWQRFSRHLPSAWRPGLDFLSTLLTFVQQELQGTSN